MSQWSGQQIAPGHLDHGPQDCVGIHEEHRKSLLLNLHREIAQNTVIPSISAILPFI
jgi:hypothetical protein